jgi:DNA-binding NtrC family response regulator
VELDVEAAESLVNLDFSWPGNVRHLEQLAARLTLEGPGRRVTAGDLRRLLDATETPELGEMEPAGATVPEPRVAENPRPVPLRSGVEIEAGLPEVVKQAERACLEEALRRHPRMTRAELASMLKVSQATLFKKLRLYGLI